MRFCSIESILWKPFQTIQVNIFICHNLLYLINRHEFVCSGSEGLVPWSIKNTAGIIDTVYRMAHAGKFFS